MTTIIILIHNNKKIADVFVCSWKETGCRQGYKDKYLLLVVSTTILLCMTIKTYMVK
jgi:hypothetical protein